MILRFSSDNFFKVRNPSAWAVQLVLDLNNKAGLVYIIDESTGETTKNFDLNTSSKHDTSGDVIHTKIELITDIELSNASMTVIKNFFKKINVELKNN